MNIDAHQCNPEQSETQAQRPEQLPDVARDDHQPSEFEQIIQVLLFMPDEPR